MSETKAIQSEPRSRIAVAIGSTWAAIMGVLPHVLHHVGPLAGAAIVAGTTGTLVFGAAAFLLTIPLLLRVRRHCGSWRTPMALLALFVVVWLLSTFVVGPRVRDALQSEPASSQLQPAGHDQHHEVDR